MACSGVGLDTPICCSKQSAALLSCAPDGLNLIEKVSENFQGLRRVWFGSDS